MPLKNLLLTVGIIAVGWIAIMGAPDKTEPETDSSVAEAENAGNPPAPKKKTAKKTAKRGANGRFA